MRGRAAASAGTPPELLDWVYSREDNGGTTTHYGFRLYNAGSARAGDAAGLGAGGAGSTIRAPTSSLPFQFGTARFSLEVFPKGVGTQYGRCLSAFLCLNTPLHTHTTLHVRFAISIVRTDGGDMGQNVFRGCETPKSKPLPLTWESPRIGWADLLPHTRLSTFQDTYGGVLVHVTLHHSLEYEYRQPIPRAMFSESRTLDCPGFTAGGVTWHLRVVTAMGHRKRDGRSTRGDFTLVDAGTVSLYIVLDSDQDSEGGPEGGLDGAVGLDAPGLDTTASSSMSASMMMGSVDGGDSMRSLDTSSMMLLGPASGSTSTAVAVTGSRGPGSGTTGTTGSGTAIGSGPSAGRLAGSLAGAGAGLGAASLSVSLSGGSKGAAATALQRAFAVRKLVVVEPGWSVALGSKRAVLKGAILTPGNGKGFTDFVSIEELTPQFLRGSLEAVITFAAPIWTCNMLEWNDVDGYVDRVTVSSADIEAATLLLEKMCLALEDNMDYPVEHVLQGGSVAVNTGVRGHMDAVLVVTMRDFVESMVPLFKKDAASVLVATFGDDITFSCGEPHGLHFSLHGLDLLLTFTGDIKTVEVTAANKRFFHYGALNEQTLFMQRHLFVQHSKAEMRVLRRGIVASKRWVMEQRWGEVRPPSPWTVEVLVVHVFLGASKETRMSTTFLLEAVIRALASWHTIEARFGTSTACTLGGPVAAIPEGGAVIEDPSDCSINLAATVTRHAGDKIALLASMVLPPEDTEDVSIAKPRIRKFR